MKNAELVGVWHRNSLNDTHTPTDVIVVFKPDGTGWVELEAGHLWSAESFEWTLTAPGWVVLNSVKRLKRHNRSGRLVEELPLTFEVWHTAYRVWDEANPTGGRCKRLRISLFSDSEDAVYNLISENPQLRLEAMASA